MSLDPARLEALVDILLPGDELFPSASSIGVAERLPERLGGVAMAQLAAALPEPLDEPAVAGLERAQPELFAQLFRTACLTYYAAREVTGAICASGVDYRTPLQPRGHELPPFDPERDTPRHRRGHFVETEEVRPIRLPEGLGR